MIELFGRNRMSLCRAAGVTGSVISSCQRVGLPQAFQDWSPWRQVKGRSAIGWFEPGGVSPGELSTSLSACHRHEGDVSLCVFTQVFGIMELLKDNFNPTGSR
ncbi:hypothetical protein CRENBAI_006848 [Crenichthys baileyi]|uniref:Uncharacterized protein n=1 Tax=Crenichthys baileyi TaxID=28760 RepID=A0AAV9S0X7_9TELE